MGITASRRDRELEGTDVIQYVNNSGSAIVNNQLVFIPSDTGYGLVGVSLGAIASTAGSVGAIMIKGFVEFPAAQVAFTQGCMAQAATSASSISTFGGTTSGLWNIGMVKDTTLSTAGYVILDLNAGPNAFKVW